MQCLPRAWLSPVGCIERPQSRSPPATRPTSCACRLLLPPVPHALTDSVTDLNGLMMLLRLAHLCCPSLTLRPFRRRRPRDRPHRSVPTSVNVPIDLLTADGVAPLRAAQAVVVVGSADHRAAQAVVRLSRVHKLPRVYYFEGGVEGWFGGGAVAGGAGGSASDGPAASAAPQPAA